MRTTVDLLLSYNLYFLGDALCAERACLLYHPASHLYCRTFSHLGVVPDKLHWCNFKLSALLVGPPVAANNREFVLVILTFPLLCCLKSATLLIFSLVFWTQSFFALEEFAGGVRLGFRDVMWPGERETRESRNAVRAQRKLQLHPNQPAPLSCSRKKSGARCCYLEVPLGLFLLSCWSGGSPAFGIEEAQESQCVPLSAGSFLTRLWDSLQKM